MARTYKAYQSQFQAKQISRFWI